jgi:hypothetical protein
MKRSKDSTSAPGAVAGGLAEAGFDHLVLR